MWLVIFASTVPALAAGRSDLGFSSGAKPLDVRPGELGLSSTNCAGCHEKEAREWERSRHRYAWSNAIFLDGYLSEPRTRCIGCHAPLKEQRREVARDVRPPPGSLAHEGITCAVCHVRDGAVLTARPAEGSMHRVTTTSALRDPQFCASCHEFAFSDGHDMMQTTFSEWRAYVEKGGAKTCQQCHMPDGAHTFPGAHDEEFLRASLAIHREGQALVIAPRDVGHAVPSGDLFRHITVEADDVVIATFGKRYDAGRNLLEDTRLLPFERRRVALPPSSKRLRVRYHYASRAHEASQALPEHNLVTVLYEE